MPNENDFNLYIKEEIAAQVALQWIMREIFQGESPEEQRGLLRQFIQKREAEQYDNADHEACRCCIEMLSALNEDSLHWISGNEREERAHRLSKYRRLRQLFELEIEDARRRHRNTGTTVKPRLVLLLAALRFRFRLPGAKELCEAAAFQMLRSIYVSQNPQAHNENCAEPRD